ncbi:MAG TPA: hypothetical protein DCM87_12970 [Planctomycetes bacterium]|nr:hypothetical protein [Planctomycetota bacterium]
MDRIRRLVERAQGGEEEAFDELAQLHRPRLREAIRSWARFQLGPRLDVEDVLQDSLLRAVKAIGRFAWDGEDSFFRWLCGIAKRALAQAVRDTYRRAPEHSHGTRIKHLEAAVPGQSTVMRREERFHRLEDALRHLPAEQREILLLARIEGLTVNEIAARTGRTAGSVKYQLAVALRGLRAVFGETESCHLPDRRLDPGDDEHDAQ